MRSFFRRPSWANTEDGNSSPDFYRRADQTYGDIVAASREARIRSVNHGCDHFQDEMAGRGQHTTEDEHHGDVAFSISPETTQVTSFQSDGPISRVTSHSEIGEDNACRSSSTKVLRPNDMSVAGVSPSRTKRLLQAQSPPRSPCVANTSFRTPRTTEQNTPLASPTHEHDQYGDNDSLSKSEIRHSKRQEDVTVQILISSKIANTKSLVIKRKIYQPLKEVRLAWCEHQKLPRALHPFVFLTWKGRRLFDVTTCKSLGGHTSGDPGASTFRDDHSDDFGCIHIHMEAVMDDQAPNYPLASSKPSPGSQQEYADLEGDKTECGSFKLVFKCPGHADYEMYVGSQMRISQLVAAYRDIHNIHAEQTIYFTFDGECLDPNSCPADHDMTHDDLVDVIIK
ncbi:small ubiquitin-related modifier domain-containing protein [Aspergillus affinis]|uniref:small ubiquitin-related modifier domain-containing protein n=1 Tax=Aspergillus affinis TaxID=1070780 RepID=UPI0022FDBC7F|nr:uncharacterized protein KD926_006786 [Aspergillus affinis]KAI9041548.1 hypothetical protein KD926_006786 [Aspergillus affinis]